VEAVRRIEIPTGLTIGAVNAYLFPASPITLVDPGPASAGSWDALVAGLAEGGLRPSDVEQIVITHGHIDHFGQADRLRRGGGARVLAPAEDAAMVGDFHVEYARRRQRYLALLAECGAPDPLGRELSAFFGSLDALGEGVAVDLALHDGDTYEAGGEFVTVVDTPGHSRGAACHLTASGLLVSGDTAIPGLTPIAAFGGRQGAVGVADSLASLDRLASLPVRHVLPGHRGPFRDLRGYVWEQHRRHDSRQQAVLSHLGSERTVWEVCLAVFGDLPLSEVFLGITEVLGHLEYLEAAERVASRHVDGVRRYVRKTA